MAKILITGAGGYIGSVATYMFLNRGYEIVGVDNFLRGFEKPLKILQEKFSEVKFKYYKADIKDDLSFIFEKEKNIDGVIHYAAMCSVDESIKYPEKYFSNNVCGTQNLLNHLLENNIKNIVFSSTCAVYGEAEYIPIDEKHKTQPTNPYGESKLMMEKIMNWYSKLKDFNYVILRYFNVCGATEDGLIGDAKKPSVHLMQNAVRGALNLEPFYLTYPKVDTKDGSPIRDYCNVIDLNEAHILAVEHLLKGKTSEIINLGTGNGNSVLEIINKVKEITGADFKIETGKARQGEYTKAIASIEKAKEVLNWEPKRTIEDSIKSLVKWYKSRPKGWSI
jgi:UDP-glucose 4-epimerase